MDILLLWRIVVTFMFTGNIFCKLDGVSGQTMFPRSVLDKALTLCLKEGQAKPSCSKICREPEPEYLCYSICNCVAASPAIQRKVPSQCNKNTKQCRCPRPKDFRCPPGVAQSCLWDDGFVCEYDTKYCVTSTENEPPFASEVCECKDGWKGPACLQCEGCDGDVETSETSNSNNTALILGFVLAIVVVILIAVVVVYWRLGRLPCHADKKGGKQAIIRQAGEKPPLGMAYSVSGPMPVNGPPPAITPRPGLRPGIASPDADTGEMDGEYVYAAINDYAVIPNRAREMPPELIASVSRLYIEPIASVSPRQDCKQENPEAIYYFKLHDEIEDTPKSEYKVPNDCYTKVIRKIKPEEHPKPPQSQYDRLDRITNSKPSPNGDRGSPSDNEYGTLASSI